MSGLVPFEFEGAPVRVVVIDGEPWFVGKDVAERLGYADPTNAMKQHCKGVVKRHPLQTAGGMQEVRVLSEPDVFRLIVGSHLPAAQRFELWLFEDVLPAVRKTGRYGAPALPDFTDPAAAARAWASEFEERRALQLQMAEAEPKVAFHDDVALAQNGQTIAEVAKVLGTGQRRLFAWLREHGLLMRSNLPYQSYVDSGWFRVVEKRRTLPGGDAVVYTQTLITGRGLINIQHRMRKGIAA